MFVDLVWIGRAAVQSDDATEPSDAFGVFWTSLPQRIGVFHPSYQNELQKAPTAPQVRAPPLSWWGAAKHALAPAADGAGEVRLGRTSALHHRPSTLYQAR